MKAVAQGVQQRRSSIDRDLVALTVDFKRYIESVLRMGVSGPRPVLIDLKHRMLLDERQPAGTTRRGSRGSTPGRRFRQLWGREESRLEGYRFGHPNSLLIQLKSTGRDVKLVAGRG